MSFLRRLIGLSCVFHGFVGRLVRGLVISCAVARRGDTVRVRGTLVEFRSSLMGIIGHRFFSCVLLTAGNSSDD